MKTLYLTRGSNILVDTENNTADSLQLVRQGIDHIYLAEEPMHIVYGAGEVHEEADAEKGDIIITFYSDTFKKQLVIVKNNEDWVNNIVEYRKKEQEEKERWAKKCQENDGGSRPESMS